MRNRNEILTRIDKWAAACTMSLTRDIIVGAIAGFEAGYVYTRVLKIFKEKEEITNENIDK